MDDDRDRDRHHYRHRRLVTAVIAAQAAGMNDADEPSIVRAIGEAVRELGLVLREDGWGRALEGIPITGRKALLRLLTTAANDPERVEAEVQARYPKWWEYRSLLNARLVDELVEVDECPVEPLAPPAAAPPAPTTPQPRLQFDDETATVILDRRPYRNVDGKAYAMLKLLSQQPPGETLTRLNIAGELPGFRGDKTVARVRKLLPTALNRLIRSNNRGMWVQLPAREKGTT